MRVCRFSRLPKWHLQGLHKGGRQHLLHAALTALQQLLQSMPLDVGRLPPQTCETVAAVMARLVACSASEHCFGYTPASLHKDLNDAQLELHALLGACLCCS